MAEIAKLEISNLFSYGPGPNVIDFDKFTGLVCIIGENGVGKSSIFECIEYALYGYTHRWSKTTFEDIVRYGENTGWVKLWFRVNGLLYSVIRGFKDKRNFIRLVNEDLESGQVKNNLTQRKLNENNEEIARLIGMDLQSFSSSIMFSQGDVSNFVAGSSTTRQGILRNVLNLQAIDKIQRKIKRRIQVLESKLTEAKAQISLLEKDDVGADFLENYLREAAQQQADLDRLNLENEELIRKSSEIEARLQQAIDLFNKVNTLESEINRQTFEFNARNSEYDNALKQLEFRREQMVGQFQNTQLELAQFNIVEINATLEQLKSQQSPINADRLRAKKIEQSQIQSRINICTSTLLTIDERGKQLTAQKKDIEKNSTCPTCRQALPANQIALRLETIQQEIDRLRASYFENQKNKNDDEALLAQTKDSIDKLELAIQPQLANEVRIKHCEEAIVRFNNLQSFCTQAQQTVSGINLEMQSVSEKLRALAPVFDGIQQLRNELSILTVQVHDVKAGVNSAQFEKKQISEQIAHNRELSGKLRQNITNLEEKAEKVAIQIALLEELKETLANGQKQLELLLKLEAIYGNKGLRVRLIQEILPELEQLMNAHLSTLSEDRMHVQFVVDNDQGSFDLLIHFDGRTSSFASFSGGEKKRILIAGSLALGEFVVSRMANHWDILCFDEVFSDLDAAGRRALLVLLSNMTGVVPKIVAITHIDDVRDLIAQQIKVVKENDISKIVQ